MLTLLLACGISGTQPEMSLGSEHSCAVTSAGKLLCWGANEEGQLGDGTTEHRSAPVHVLAGVVDVAAGSHHTCAATTTGEVYCWGSDTLGQVTATQGSFSAKKKPVAVPGLADAVEVIAGDSHSCARTKDGRVSCWGTNNRHELGTSDRSATGPVTVSGVEEVSALAASGPRTCAVAGGGIWCWGAGREPTQIDNISAATGIAIGLGHACAVISNGDLACWGGDHCGQVSGGVSVEGEGPHTLSSLSGIQQVAVGEAHTCAIDSEGTVSCWGCGSGVLGDGKSIRRQPGAIPDLRAQLIASGPGHSCALGSQDAVWCWGEGARGQVGDGDKATAPRLTATAITLPK